MKNVVFKPWIGSNFESSKLGSRVLVVGESHYGEEGSEHDGFTADVVKACGQTDRLPFFTKIAKTLLNYDSSNYLDDQERADIWEQVAFYNYIQKFVGDTARIRPTNEMWEAAEHPFLEVVQSLKPEVIIVLGKTLAEYLPSVSDDIAVCYLQHPSSGGYSYAVNNPLVLKALSGAKQ